MPPDSARGLRSAILATKPKILHILHSSAIGGGPVSVGLLVLGTKDEFDPVVISSGEGQLPAQLQAEGVEFHALPLTTKWSFLANTWKLSRLIRQIAPDVIHLHGHWAGSIGQLAVVLAGRPATIYTVRWPAYSDDTDPVSVVRNWLVEWFSCAMATIVVAISDFDRQTLIRRRICSSRKLEMIHNAYAVDPAPVAPNRPTPEIVNIGFVGRLVAQKGCDLLIAAYARLAAGGLPARLTIVGDGPDRSELERRVEDMRLGGSVEFLGFQPDGAALMAEMDIVAVPSRFEPFGIVAVEAMAQGRPVVAAAVGGLTETVVDGTTGRLVPAGDPARLADALADLVRSSALREQMGEAGRERAIALFSPDRVVAAYKNLYRRLSAARETAPVGG